MEGTCPHCSSRLELPASGAYRCERCRRSFRVALGRVVSQPAAGFSGLLTPASTQRVAPPAALLENRPYYGPDEFLRRPRHVLPPPETDAAEAGTGGVCAAHADSRAVGLCERCGDFLCRRCTTAAEGRVYCPGCFALLNGQGSFAVSHPQSALPGASFVLGVVAVCTAVLGVLSGPALILLNGLETIGLVAGGAGVALALRALGELRQRPRQSGGTLAVWGAGLSGVGIFLALVSTATGLAAVFRR